LLGCSLLAHADTPMILAAPTAANGTNLPFNIHASMHV